MKIIFTIFSCMLFNLAYSQADKAKILKSFDKIVYYPDSTIKYAYQTKGQQFEGYSMEFDEKGEVNYIGRYHHGKKWGWWIRPDNTRDYYAEGVYSPDLVPACGTGSPTDFRKLYNGVLGSN